MSKASNKLGNTMMGPCCRKSLTKSLILMRRVPYSKSKVIYCADLPQKEYNYNGNP